MHTVTHRRKSRELVLQTLYACDMTQNPNCAEIFGNIVENNSFPHEAQLYARELAVMTMNHRDEIDEQLKLHTSNWEIKRLAAIDRNIIRMAVSELLFFKDVPYKVVIDEAVEIAKIYGAEDSGKFVNGVIDSIYKGMVP